MQVTVARVYVGPFMTSLDMAGFSLSLLLLNDARIAALDAPTQATLLCPLIEYGSQDCLTWAWSPRTRHLIGDSQELCYGDWGLA